MHRRQQNTWKPGFWTHLPLAGLLSLLGAILATLSTVAVLVFSDEKPTASWPSSKFPIQPAVLLAILTTVANALISWALYDGVVIAWWTKMLRGATLKEVHNYWEHGSSAWHAFLAGRNFNKIANACLLAFLVFVDGPLLQRASGIRAETLTVTTAVGGAGAAGGEGSGFQVWLVSERGFPANYSGVYMTRANTVSGITPAMAEVVRDFSSRKGMAIWTAGCRGVCRGEVVGPGWDVRCNSSTRAYNMTSPKSGDIFPAGYATVHHDKGTPDRITVETAHKPNPGFVGDIVLTTCVLHHAIVRYSVEVTNPNNTNTKTNIINLSPDSPQLSPVTLLPLPPLDQNATINLLRSNRSETSAIGIFPSALGGFALAAKTIYNSSISIYFTSGTYALDPSTSGPMVYTHRTNMGGDNTKAALTADKMAWVDPAGDIVNALREMAFRGALGISSPPPSQSPSTSASGASDPGVSTNTTTTTNGNANGNTNGNGEGVKPPPQNLRQEVLNASQTMTLTIYTSHYVYLAVALALMFIAILAILPLYSRWWELGRQVSLSPLETGRALEAPLLASESENGGVKGILKEVGKVRVRYGVIRKEGGGGERWVLGRDGTREEGGVLLG